VRAIQTHLRGYEPWAARGQGAQGKVPVTEYDVQGHWGADSLGGSWPLCHMGSAWDKGQEDSGHPQML
jgi:hypothetical protein